MARKTKFSQQATPAREPIVVNGAWTIPPGFVHPVCPKCGLTCFSQKPQPWAYEGLLPKGNICSTCAGLTTRPFPGI